MALSCCGNPLKITGCAKVTDSPVTLICLTAKVPPISHIRTACMRGYHQALQNDREVFREHEILTGQWPHRDDLRPFLRDDGG